MGNARSLLLDRIIAEVADNGLADRSLRDIATSVGSSHRMLHYHFDSREGLIKAIVESTEQAQRDLLDNLANEVDDPADLVRLLWAQVSSAEMLPFVRLFFECVALSGTEMTSSWLELSSEVADRLGQPTNLDEIRLGVAVTRGLLIDVLATGDPAAATRSLEEFLRMWNTAR